MCGHIGFQGKAEIFYGTGQAPNGDANGHKPSIKIEQNLNKIEQGTHKGVNGRIWSLTITHKISTRLGRMPTSV